MGSIIVLNQTQQKPFHTSLKKLQQVLNTPGEIETLSKRGLYRIFLVASFVRGGSYKNLFGNHSFKGWMEDKSARMGDSFFNFLSFSKKVPSPKQSSCIFEELCLLRDMLNKEDMYEELVKIGPCELILLWRDLSALSYGPKILITNYIPGCWPNLDYAINPPGKLCFES